MKLRQYLHKEKHIAPLATFRVAFGVLMLLSIVRFWSKGWIDTQYIQPEYFFTYYGFNWVKPLGNPGMYILFGVMGIAALFVALGFLYRYSATLFFLLFTYVELIDKTNYLNHYYFVSIMAFLLIWVPANASYSLDAKWGLVKSRRLVPAWSIDIFKLQLGIVYFYAGLAKLNFDWLFEAMPLKMWLPAKSHTPLIGWLFDYKWTAYFFSWFGAAYDLSIPFLLLWSRTRWLAYFAVIAFHVLTAILFPIGMFPYIMIVATLIYFSEDFHKSLWEKLGFSTSVNALPERRSFGLLKNALLIMLAVHFALQLLLPFRYKLYGDNLFWHEQGYRFSWRVMLMEKSGYTNFIIEQKSTGKKMAVEPSDYLTPVQLKMMSTQPDMTLQFAHHLQELFEPQYGKVAVYANSYVALNGKGSKKFIADSVDLSAQKRGLQPKNWILPFND